MLTEAEEERLNELMARYDALENQCEESGLLEAKKPGLSATLNLR